MSENKGCPVIPKVSGGALDTLVAMIERGPLASDYIPSKNGRNELLALGLACEVVVADGECHYGATAAGSNAYIAEFGGFTLQEAKQARQARSSTLNPLNTLHPPVDTLSLAEGIAHHRHLSNESE